MNERVESVIARIVYYKNSLFYKSDNYYAKAILVVRPEGIGDMVCTVPFLRELRKNYPEYRIDLVCSPLEKNMMEICPYIDNLYEFDMKTEKHRFKTLLHRSIKFAKNNLVNQHYEIAIAPSYANPGGYVEAWLGLFAHAKRRIGMSEKVSDVKHKIFRGSYDIFFTELLNEKNIFHEVACGLNYIRYLGGTVESDKLELWTSKEDNIIVDRLFAEQLVPDNTIKIVVNLSTSAKYKDWPVENYADVCKKIMDRYPVSLLLIGGGNTAKVYADKFKKEIPQAYDFVNKTTIRQTIEVMKRANFYLGGDTGPMHIAAAVGMGGVAIFCNAKDYSGDPHKNAAVWFAPWKSSLEIVQPEYALPGCEHGCVKENPHCIMQVRVEEVYDKLSCVIEEQKISYQVVN